MTIEEATKYAENMTYREAIHNLKQAKSIPYRKATFIKVNELLNDLKQEPILEKDGTLIVTTEHCGNVGRVLVQYGTNGTLFYQDQEPETVPVAVVKFSEDKLREIVQEKVDEIKENLIEQYLDKITAEIEEAQTYDGIYIDRAYVLEIIYKYKAEIEVEDGNDD